jgi:hypothetical protein
VVALKTVVDASALSAAAPLSANIAITHHKKLQTIATTNQARGSSISHAEHCCSLFCLFSRANFSANRTANKFSAAVNFSAKGAQACNKLLLGT